MREKIALMTDTVANLPNDYIKANNIYVISLYVVVDEKYYKDGIEISPDDMFRLNEDNPNFSSKSASPSPNDFSQTFKKIKDDGYDKVIFIGMGSNLSSTILNSNLADKHDLEVEVIDSKTVTILEGLLVMYANDLLEDGLEFDEIVSKLNKAVGNSIAIGWIDSLRYLKAGGRLGKAASKVSTALNFKPFMSIDGNGDFDLYKLKISREKSYAKTIERVKERLEGKENYYMAYLHGKDIGILDGVKNDLTDLEKSAKGVFQAPTGSVVAVHVGPQIYAVAYLLVD